jgi:hypothetical protein
MLLQTQDLVNLDPALLRAAAAVVLWAAPAAPAAAAAVEHFDAVKAPEQLLHQPLLLALPQTHVAFACW